MVAKSAAPKILVVDDDVRLRDLLTRYLAEQGKPFEPFTDFHALSDALAA